MSWYSQVDDMIKSQMQKVNRFYRKVSLDVYTEVVIRTPVDVGTLRNNWNLSLNFDDTSTTNTADRSGSNGINKANSTLKNAVLKDEIYISNHMPYAERIEYGYSSIKAPQGMVRVTVAKWKTFLEDNKNELA